MIIKQDKKVARLSRCARIRSKIEGTSARPRLAVFRSNKNIEAQIIDDEKGITLVSASTFEKGNKFENGSNVEAAALVGKAIAERALAKGINEVVFDRGGFLYQGRVKAVAEAAREAGLKF